MAVSRALLYNRMRIFYKNEEAQPLTFKYLRTTASANAVLATAQAIASIQDKEFDSVYKIQEYKLF